MVETVCQDTETGSWSVRFMGPLGDVWGPARLGKRPSYQVREKPWTTTWFYDLRTNEHFTPKRNKLTRQHLQPVIDAYRPDDRSQRVEPERFNSDTYEHLVARDQVSLDLT